MRKASLRCAVLAAALTQGFSLAPLAHAESITYHCQRVEAYPYRKYECSGTAIEYGGLVCSASWADIDSDGSWTTGDARVYQIDCNGTWNYSCSDTGFFNYACSGQGISPSSNNDVCHATWADDDPDPYYSSSEVITNSCSLLEDVTSR